MTRRTKQALSDDAKLARLDIIAKNHKIKNETITALKEKYGPYAYDIVTDALMKPCELMQRIGQKGMSSVNVIKYFTDNELDTAILAKAVKKDEATVQSTLTNYNINTKEEQRTNQPETTAIHDKSAKAENNFNQKVTNTSSLSENKEKQIKSWAKSVGLDGEKTIQKLTEKYGELAYDIIHDSMYKPSVIMRNMGEKAQGSSRKTIEYFIDNDLTAEQLSKALKKPLEKVQTALPQNETQSKTQNETQNETPTPEDIQQITDDRLSIISDEKYNMTLNDYLKSYTPDEAPLKGQAFIDEAIKDFGLGEGVVNNIYVEWQNKGNPTIGVGNLIIPMDLCKLNPTQKAINKCGTVEGYKQRFREMDLTNAQGKKLTNAEKDKIFEDLRKAVREGTLKTAGKCPYTIISPASAANVRMSNTAIIEQTKKDLTSKLKRTYASLGKGNEQKGKEIFEKYPKSLQLALVHCYYGGTPGMTITNEIKRGNLDPTNPQAMYEKINQLRPEKGSPSRKASKAERATITQARDSLSTARRRRYAEIQRSTTIRTAAINGNQGRA